MNQNPPHTSKPGPHADPINSGCTPVCDLGFGARERSKQFRPPPTDFRLSGFGKGHDGMVLARHGRPGHPWVGCWRETSKNKAISRACNP